MIALILAALLQAAPATSYSIAGTLVNSVTGEALGKARVSIIAAAEPRNSMRAMITGPDGHFHFEGLPAGKYMLSAERLGFVAQSYMERTLYQELATGIAVGEGFSSDNLVFRLIPSSVIAGYITDVRGDPIVGLNVLAMRVAGAGAARHILQTVASRTDDRGYYRIRSLATGRYVLAMYGDGGIATKEADPALAYPITYFPGTIDPYSAQPIALEAGREVRCDTTVTAMGSATLHGEVASHRPANSLVTISAIGPYGSRFDMGHRTNTSTLGGFTFANLAPGRYAVHLWTGQGIGGYREVDLVAGDNQVSLGETPLASVKAKVEVHGGRAGSAVLVLRKVGSVEGDSKRLDADGLAAFATVAPGLYEVYVTNGQTMAMVSFTSRGAESSGSVLRVPESGAVELEILADAAATEVRGHVYDGDQPQAGVLAMLVPKTGWENTSTYRFDQSDSDGSFAWQGVPRGEYLLFAFAKGELADYLDAQLVRSLLPKGQPLMIGEGPPEPVKLSLTK
jgi:protocatechuate 3,4-dioxygenase beta subunit